MHGLEIRNTGGRMLISTHAPALVYIGKATLETTLWMSEQASSGLEVYFYLSSGNVRYNESTYTPDPATGVHEVWLHSTCGQSARIEWPVPDSAAIRTYLVYAPARPVVFIAAGSGASAVVASIHATGTTQAGTGWPQWRIKVFAGYTEDTRSDLNALALYCFAQMPDETVSGHGLALWDADSRLCYSTSRRPVRIIDALTLNSVTGGSGLSIDYDTDTGAVYTATKPAFLAADWLRAEWYQTSPGTYGMGGWNSYYGVCSGSAYRYAILRQHICGLGFRVSGSSIVAAAGGAYFKELDWSTGAPTPNPNGTYEQITTHLLPMTIPIIDGADYD